MRPVRYVGGAAVEYGRRMSARRGINGVRTRRSRGAAAEFGAVDPARAVGRRGRRRVVGVPADLAPQFGQLFDDLLEFVHDLADLRRNVADRLDQLANRVTDL